ncbi:response regulator [Sediminicoccus rosea]|jgi:two-component system chemotaxis response regulator CheY|uniref:Response regulator n=1 Tax=Sediminicoccus rosea TaxID=1225128 RepID=A0ABZ0PEU0_9PROT|nr:response regulator [Sediminicoccus rosea]WPB83796.1 response regulator [Sediminicoccus rosea]
MKPVMLVDDSPTMLASMASVLNQSGQPVERAASAEEALAKLKAAPPLRAMITDYHMPGMNGAALVREMRKLPAYRFLPILVLTTESEQTRRDEARAAGATGWLVKPVAPDKLIEVLRQVAPV